MLQIILVGQLDLESLLTRPDLRQFQQRVSRRIRLAPLGEDELQAYIDHRLAIGRSAGSRMPGAGDLARALDEWAGDREGVTFTPDAVQAIWRWSGGLPRLVNLLCDRALEAAYAQQLHRVDGALVEAAAIALDLRPPSAPVATALEARAVEASLPHTIAPQETAPEPVAPERTVPEAVAPKPVAPKPIAPEPVALEAFAPEAVAPPRRRADDGDFDAYLPEPPHPSAELRAPGSQLLVEPDFAAAGIAVGHVVAAQVWHDRPGRDPRRRDVCRLVRDPRSGRRRCPGALRSCRSSGRDGHARGRSRPRRRPRWKQRQRPLRRRRLRRRRFRRAPPVIQ